MTVRKRNGRREAGSRTAQLEEKLEDLVSLLRNQSTAVKPPDATNTTSTPTTTAAAAAAQERSPLDLWINTPGLSHGSQSDTAAGSSDERTDSKTVTGSPLGPQTTAAFCNSVFIPGLFPHQQSTVPIPITSMIQYPYMPATPSQAQEQLTLFRERYLQCFPCIYIPPDMTSEQLREEKPFSWFTIMMMACQTSSLQFGMGAVWQRIISQKIVIEHEKNMDLLQGMVIYLAWSVSLVLDMGS